MLNEIKSSFILNMIFDNLKKRLKLKIINHNKNLINRLDIEIKDFRRYKLLKNLNNNHILKIDDFDNVKEINLSKNLDYNCILECLSTIELNDLKILDLSNNKIDNINILMKVNFEQL